MKIDRKELRASIYDYVKANYWALFTPLFIIFVITSIVDIIIGWVLITNNLTDLVYVSTLITYFFSIYGFGVYTIALVDCLRTEQKMSVKLIIDVMKKHNLRLFLLSIEMTFLLVILAVVGAMIHPIVESLVLAFMMLAYAFAFPISVDQPSLTNIAVISASFKQTTGLRWDMFLLQTKPLLIALFPLVLALMFSNPFVWLTSNNPSNGIIVFWFFIVCTIILILYVMPKALSVSGFVYQANTPQGPEVI
ncbi:MAG: hypothetical protein KGZ51_08330 [Erysipelothrix sp.]|nr:hypothetical protein [Erysipelothrix sp.]